MTEIRSTHPHEEPIGILTGTPYALVLLPKPYHGPSFELHTGYDDALQEYNSDEGYTVKDWNDYYGVTHLFGARP